MGKKILLLSVLLFINLNLLAQDKPWKRKITRPELWWAVKHCFIAPRALKLTKQSLKVTHEVRKDTILDGDSQGGQVDAFRHAYWMAVLAQKFRPVKVQKLGIAHEKGNYIDFKKKRLEDGIPPDKISSAMDLNNNARGVEIGHQHPKITADSLQMLVIQSIKQGDMVMLYKDKSGNYLQCNDSIIDLKQYEGEWSIPKCIVPTARPVKK